MLEWYKRLYIGDNAKKKEKWIKWCVNHKIYPKQVYLVTLASNPKNLLDVFSVKQLKHEFIKQKCPLILGMGLGKDDAVKIVQQIVEETYKSQGNTNVQRYLKERLQ